MTTNHPHFYVDCDIPEGMTILEWRRRWQPPQTRWTGLRLARRGRRSMRPLG